ncbi:IQ calmodulin-binding motif protein [Rutstroemia sp. NJR-2017a WRK4]|nr:IQ calmodulin-binding motif protein [Rutstroemia sp. NJR-2017a WRK4]
MTLYQNLEAIISLFIQVFVIFPYSALTIQRQRDLLALKTQSIDETTDAQSINKSRAMISDKVYKLCKSSETVSSILAKDPSIAPGDAWKQLYGAHAAGEKESKATARSHRDTHTPEDLQRALECGNWGPTQPSELFLKNFSRVPDIMRHMSNLIVRAEKEVILATNYWQNSVASKYITNAMKELSRRAGERGERIVFKLQYDRGSPKQLLDNHYIVSEKEYLGKAVALPQAHEIPNIDLQVMNYHKPMLGTFHCKYMVVDRKFAVLQSNNIQDNDNMEMMTHLEGPIVDSLYDMALISWHKKFEPPLPSHNSPAAQGGLSSFKNKSHDEIFSENGSLRGHSAIVHPEKMREQKPYSYEPRAANQPGVVPQDHSSTTNGTGPSTTESIVHPVEQSNGVNGIAEGLDQVQLENKEQTEHGFQNKDLNTREMISENARAVASTGDTEHIVHTTDSNANGGGEQVSPKKHNFNSHGLNGPDAETQEFLNAGTQVLPQSQIEHPSPSGNLLPEHTTDDPHYDVDIAGEVARVQTAVSPKPGDSRIQAVTRHLNHTKNEGFKGNAPECAPEEEMTPYIPHPVHEPFPIAMVCREPHGAPNHNSVYNPQNEVWLSALRNAKKNVFIQSPTLNAEPLVPEIISACERGIDVYCYITLGYNDTGELLPMQGGTNEMIAHKMYTTLSAAGKSHLHYFFYIGKDQTTPLVAKKKLRDCHVKVMIVDEHIGIQGNGNQDTQSWFHSQEINVMFDSAMVCKGWIDGLRRNQNTHLYGEVGKEDGIWRDENGEQAKDVIGVDPGRFSWAKGFMGAINRVRGTGDF